MFSDKRARARVLAVVLIVVVLLPACQVYEVGQLAYLPVKRAASADRAAGPLVPDPATDGLGHQMADQVASGWAPAPGHSLYHSVLTPDGSMLVADQPQSGEQGAPTMDDMVITRFGLGRTAVDGQNIAIRTSAGHTTLGWGADVSDVERLSSTRVLYSSANPAWSYSGEAFPSFGQLVEHGSTWAPDPSTQVTATQLHRSSAAGADACSDANCHFPSELAKLARGDVAVAQYASDLDGHESSGQLSILSPQGTSVLANFDLYGTDPGDGHLSVYDTRRIARPRSVQADPVPVDGQERFSVVYDTNSHDASKPAGRQDATLPFAVQVFSFDGTRIRAVTKPFFLDPAFPTEETAWDSFGNLWLGTYRWGGTWTSDYKVAVYSPAALAACAQPASADPMASWGAICAPSRAVLVHGTQVTKLQQVLWDDRHHVLIVHGGDRLVTVHASSFAADPARSTLGLGAVVGSQLAASRARAVETDPGLRNDTWTGPSSGSVQGASYAYAVTTVWCDRGAGSVAATCPFPSLARDAPSGFPQMRTLPQWVVRVDLDAVLGRPPDG